jgi:hypothetical protein
VRCWPRRLSSPADASHPRVVFHPGAQALATQDAERDLSRRLIRAVGAADQEVASWR